MLENELNIEEDPDNYKYKNKIPYYKSIKKGKEKISNNNENDKEEYDDSNDKDLHLNNINFNKKETVLKAINASNYFNKVFYPNKIYNNFLILIQKGIKYYYKYKGTDDENKWNNINEKINDKLKNLMFKKNCPLINKDFSGMEVNDSVKEFKNYEYYPKITKAYLMKLNNIDKDNDPTLDEFCFFLFNQDLKSLVENENVKSIINEKKYIKEYFEKNIELLQPEIYSFVINSNFYTEDEFENKFTQFSVRKRELCINFFNLYYLFDKSKEVVKQQSLLEKCHFISSPEQILAKLNSATNDDQNEVFEIVQEKLQNYYPKMWGYISRVLWNIQQ